MKPSSFTLDAARLSPFTWPDAEAERLAHDEAERLAAQARRAAGIVDRVFAPWLLDGRSLKLRFQQLDRALRPNRFMTARKLRRMRRES